MQESSGMGSIHIALCFDDGFWAPAYATMRSICLWSHRRTDLVFHLCHRALTDAHKADLEKISDEFGAALRFHDVTRAPEFVEIVSRLPYDKRLTDVIYARLLFDCLLPSDLQRLIYLDCDMMVRAPIEALWETDMEGKTIGAVADPWGQFYSIGSEFRANADLYDPADPYFNSGLLLIDLERWRAADLIAKLNELAESGTMARLYYDQGFLNLAFKNDFKELEWVWNFTSPKPEHERLNIRVFHYTGYAKPWNLYARVAFFRIYRNVMTNALYYRYWRFRMKKRLAKVLPFIKVN